MRAAVESGHRALGATVGAVFGGIVPLTKPYPLSTKLISPSPPARAPAAGPPTTEVFAIGNVDVVGAVLGLCLVLLGSS